jgi:CelD/BcsL family acetyltransferase involved in cellulose biosynthesis
MIHVQEINDIRQLAGYRLLWNALLPQTPGASFFHSLDWLEVYWRHFGGGQRLRVLAVCTEGRPLGILPLVVRTERTKVGSVRVLTYPLHDWGTFYGPIGPNPTATLLVGLRHIRQTRRDWDVMDLRWVDLDGQDRGRTEQTMGQAGFRPHKQAWDRAALVEFPDAPQEQPRRTWRDYWDSRDRKFRDGVDRSCRRLAAQGDVGLVRYRPEGSAHGDGDPRWDLFDACVTLAERSWQGAATDGTTLCHPQVSDFFRDAHEAAARAGAVDLNLLVLAGQPIAFSYHYCYDGRVYGLRKGFDPAYSSLRPGMVLQKMVLEDGILRGDRVFDLGVGALENKRHWQTSLATSFRFTHFPTTISRVQFLRLSRWLRSRMYGEQDVACGGELQIAN